MGIACAIRSGAGTVPIGLMGSFVFRQPVDFPASLGMGPIIAGVVVINLFSRPLSR